MIDYEKEKDLEEMRENLESLQVRYDYLVEDYDKATERLASEMRLCSRYRQEALRLQQQLNSINKDDAIQPDLLKENKVLREALGNAIHYINEDSLHYEQAKQALEQTKG